MIKAGGVLVGVALVFLSCGGRSAIDEDTVGPRDASPPDVHDASAPDGCPSGTESCGGECVPDSPTSCGPSCAACPVPLFGSAVCDQGTCGVSCQAGYEPCDDACCTRQITAGQNHTCYLDIDGSVYCWGSNDKGQIDDGPKVDRVKPTRVLLDSKAIAITAGAEHTCALTPQGAVVCWGDNGSGQLGDGTTTGRGTPGPVTGLSSGVTFVDAGSDMTCAIVEGEVRCWGTLIESIGSPTPTPASGVAVGEAREISVGGEHVCVLTQAGGVKCWGRSFTLGSQRGTDSANALDVDDLGSDVRSLSAGGAHTCAARTKGDLFCWGSNLRWQLGHGTSLTIAFSPVVIPDVAHPVTAVASGSAHTCALIGDERVQCWGDASKLQYPNAGGAAGQTPVTIAGITAPVALFTAGYAHTCVAFQDHRVACWGANRHGQLGDGTKTATSSPVFVAGLPPG